MGAIVALAADRTRRLARPLRLRDVRLMWLSDLLSVIGDAAAVLGLAILTLSRTHSPVAVAVISAAAFAPAFGIGPYLATFADRVPYRQVMIASDLLRAGCYATVIAVAMPFPVLVVVVFVAHCATFPFSAARAAQLPQIAGDAYGAAQSLAQATFQVGVLLGSAGGGAIVAVFGARAAIGVDVVSFAVSAALVGAVRARARTADAQPGSPAGRPWRRLASGWQTLRHDPLLFWPAVMVTVTAVGTAAVEAMAVVLAHALRPSTAGSGSLAAVLLGTLPVATLLAGIVAPAEGQQHRLVRAAGWMGLGSHVAASALLLLAAGVSVGVGVAAVVGVYVVLGVSCAMTVPCVTVVGQRLPDDNRASVFSLLEAMLLAGQAVGAVSGGWLVSVLGPERGLVVLLCPAVVVCAVALGHVTGAREPVPS